jgi:hypothetical protein
MSVDSKIEFENDRVRVSRVTHHGRVATPSVSRQARLIVYLRDGHVTRSERGKREEIRRKAGDVVWRPQSEHAVHNEGEGEHEVLVIELKT